MMEDKGIIINKYGAVDIKEIKWMQDSILILKQRCTDLENTIAKIAGVIFPKEPMGFSEGIFFDIDRRQAIRKLIKDIKKIRELTKCDDYEFVTTTETKLVKKAKEKGK